MNKKCPKCETENKELYWVQDPKGKWICAYCYNGNWSIDKITKLRNKQNNDNKK